MSIDHLDIRLENEIYKKAKKASALLGLASLTEYVVRLIDEDATKIIAEHERITVAEDEFDTFMQACTNITTPIEHSWMLLSWPKSLVLNERSMCVFSRYRGSKTPIIFSHIATFEM